MVELFCLNFLDCRMQRKATCVYLLDLVSKMLLDLVDLALKQYPE